MPAPLPALAFHAAPLAHHLLAPQTHCAPCTFSFSLTAVRCLTNKHIQHKPHASSYSLHPSTNAAPAYKYLSQNPLYLTGESFAGHYLPSIGAYMKFSAPHMKLSGIALGNPCTNAPADYSSYPNWAYSKGLLDAATYKTAM
jgi:hypothetical protein